MATTSPVPPLTPEKISALKAAHGEILKVSLRAEPEFFVVVRAPSGPEYRRTMDRKAESELAFQRAIEQLGKDCAVYPEGEALAALFTAKPGLAYLAGDQALEMSGIAKIEAEKL